MDFELDRRPLIVAVAGSNGAGKSTFFDASVRHAGLRFINADSLAQELGVDAYDAASITALLRRELVEKRESFAFETVLSDPIGEKVEFLRSAAVDHGYAIVLIFIGLDSAATSEERVAMRVTQGGHNVPTNKLRARYQRTLANLARAIAFLPRVYVFDQSNLENPFRFLAAFRNGRPQHDAAVIAEWPDWHRQALAAAASAPGR